jgi:hypothetical protein
MKTTTPSRSYTTWARTVSRTFALFLGVAVLTGLISGSTRTAIAALPGTSVNLRILVITAEKNDFTLAPIREALEFQGTPYDLHVAADNPGALLTGALRTGAIGHYNGVIMTSASLGYSPDNGATWLSALTPDEWAALAQYESDFGVRRLNWYGYPGPDQGFNWPNASVDTSANPIFGQWTAEGATEFVYLNSANDFPITNVWAYLATPLDTNTKTWMTDGAGNALIASVASPDGREVATVTFDSATWVINSSALYHGLVNWVSRGLLVGQRHTYVTAQIDDVFLADDIYTGGEYRQDANDWNATIAWQQNFNQRPSGTHFRFDMAFNGLGTEPGQYVPDDLTPQAAATESVFKWISHTWSHPYLDNISYNNALPEIVQNNQKAVQLGLTEYSIKSMVTPNITGLENPNFLNAAYDSGIRYLVTDTSIAYHRAPSPNVGIPNWHVPGILMIPRHANNLFYNVSTPAQWEAEYNFIYNSYWGRNLTYSEIIDDQSDLLLRAILKGDVSPQMFHQPNLRDYNGQGNTLLGDLLDAVADKYEYYYNFPFLSPTQDELGETLQWRMDLNDSRATTLRNADGSITVTAANRTAVPVTGMKTPDAEFYANQWITYVTLSAGETKTFTPDGQGGYVPPTTIPENNPPTANNFAATTDSVTAIPVTLSGSDPDNDPISYLVTSSPTLGTLTGTAPNLTYLPSGTAGTDTFQYNVSDGEFTATATVTITVNPLPVNNPPTANDSAVSVRTRRSKNFTLRGTDPDGDPLTYTILTVPTLGTLSGTAPNLKYTAGRSTGTDTIQFSVSDGEFTSTATLTVTVTGKRRRK